MRPIHSTSPSPDTPPSLASQLPQGICGVPRFCARCSSLWERACPRCGPYIQHLHFLIHRHRWQASSHRGCVDYPDFVIAAVHCGSGLARDAPIHSTSPFPDTPPSLASQLPQGICGVPRFCARCSSLWERACPRWCPHIQHHHRLIHRHRWQASSHRGFVVRPDFVSGAVHCGSGLARDAAHTFNITIA